MYYVFQKSDGTRTISLYTAFEQPGYMGKIVFKGTMSQCINFIKQ